MPDQNTATILPVLIKYSEFILPVDKDAQKLEILTILTRPTKHYFKQQQQQKQKRKKEKKDIYLEFFLKP